jgi:hydrogenase maturation protein HypF
MEDFPMCPACRAEYTDPLDRRFHSQTNSCPECGITYWLEDPHGNRIGGKGKACFTTMAGWLEAGKILAVKNTSGYLLVCDARNATAVKTLRTRKKRPSKPFALMYPGLQALEKVTGVPPAAREALQSPERPIVLLMAGKARETIAFPEIAPGLDQVGVMLPYSGVLSMLAAAFPYPVVATSGNLHGAPICSSREEATENLRGVADYFLHHDLKILNAQDDSVLRFGQGPVSGEEAASPILIRRARGYAPNFSRAAGKGAGSRLLALGADLKSSIAFIPNDFLYISQYLGNLGNYDVYQRFSRNVGAFCKLFHTLPTAVLTDAHPGYQSVRFGREWAHSQGLPRISIQHHKAHFAALLGEHNLWDCPEPVLGVVWDGTGYGDDGTIWGGEFFSYASGRIQRVGQLEAFPWLAGDKMAGEPRLSLLSLKGTSSRRVREKFSPAEWQVYQSLRKKGRLKTSSMGRLFDASASLLGLCDIQSYEGEAAMYLEALARKAGSTARRPLFEPDGTANIPAAGMLDAIEEALEAGKPPADLAADFLYTLAGCILARAEAEGFGHIGFSGGVFQNSLLVSMIAHLNQGQRKLYFHRELSPNDENIAFGQLMYYLYCDSRAV